MVSLFTRMVAAGVQVPAIDRRIEGHTEVTAVVDPSDEGQAAPADGSADVEDASAGQPTSDSVS